MKKIINIIALILLISFNSNAQNNYQIKRATSFSEYATTQLKLSNEEKKQIYKASRNELVKTLNTRFNTEKTKAIMASVKELRDKEK